MNYPDGMTSRDWDHVEGVGLEEPREPRVLRVVAYLTFEPSDDPLDYAIEEEWYGHRAEQEIARWLGRRINNQGLSYTPDDVQVVDAEWMSVAESQT